MTTLSGSPGRELFVKYTAKMLILLRRESRHSIDMCAIIKEAEAEFDKMCEDCPVIKRHSGKVMVIIKIPFGVLSKIWAWLKIRR